MKKTILGCLGVVAAIAAIQFVQAEVYAGHCNDCDPCTEVGCCDPCEPIACDPCEKVSYCDPCDDIFCDPCGKVGCGKKSLWVWGGHLEAGVWANEYGRTDVHGKDMNYATGAGLKRSGNTDMLHNVRQTDFQMHQLYLYFGKQLDTRYGWDFGGQVDFMYGTDARYAQSSGLEKDAGRGAWDGGDYYTALAQMYFEAGYKQLSVKVGKFFTPMGHNSLLSDRRFFYSLSDSFAALPVTHTGAVATWQFNKKFSVFGGWVNGENQFFETSDDNAFLGGFNFEYNKRLSFAYGVLIGKNDYRNADNDYFVQSFVVDYKPGKRWDYTFEWTLRNEKQGAARWGQYGINNELLYKVNKRWSVGARAEWMHYYGGGQGNDKYNFSLGANWSPRSWITVRPELRYDKYDGSSAWANRFPEKDYSVWRSKQLSGGVSAVVKY